MDIWRAGRIKGRKEEGESGWGRLQPTKSFASFSGRWEGTAAEFCSTLLRAPGGAWTSRSDPLGSIFALPLPAPDCLTIWNLSFLLYKLERIPSAFTNGFVTNAK